MGLVFDILTGQEYVFNSSSGGSSGTTVTSANNGLSLNGSTVQLGGAITVDNTAIYSAGTPYKSLFIGYKPIVTTGGTTLLSSGFTDIEILSNANNSALNGALSLNGSSVGLSSTDNIHNNQGYLSITTSATGVQTSLYAVDNITGDQALVSLTSGDPINRAIATFGVGSNGVGASLTNASLTYFDTGSTVNHNIYLQNSGIQFVPQKQVTPFNFQFWNLTPTGSTIQCGGATAGGFAITDVSMGLTTSAIPKGQSSFAMGHTVQATGKYSFAAGNAGANTTKPVLATGQTSFNFSENTSSQSVNFGALATQCAILGGQDHNIPKTSSRCVVLGGNRIQVTAGVVDTVHMPKVRVGLGQSSTLPSFTTGATLIARNTTTGDLGTLSSSYTGHKTLTGGTATVSTAAVTASSVILLTIDGGTQTNAGTVRVSARSAGTSFTITSSNASDTSQVGWLIIG